MGKRKNKKHKHSQSTISQHTRKGTVLTPPLKTIPQLKGVSWRDERLPEMLWAILIAGQLNQEESLAIFRHAIQFFMKFEEDDDISGDVRLSGLEQMSPEMLEGFLNHLMKIESCRELLRPLLLFQDLPAFNAWQNAIGLEPSADDWSTLNRSVAATLFHQSQESTDCRWLRLMCVLAVGKLKLGSKEQFEEYVNYPNVEMKKVRPTIRATEGAIDRLTSQDSIKNDWADKFWKRCFEDTECFPINLQFEEEIAVGTSSKQLDDVYRSLIIHAYETQTTSFIDARHDTVFGIGLYCLSILKEMLHIGMSQSITSRFALRTIVDCLISLSYLASKDDPELWNSYRTFGAGQAKLSYLKLVEMDDAPSYVNIELLKELANEDLWEEFLPIELGHWEKPNTRKMSEEADVKDIYDRFYSWTSTFSHGHWGALRNSIFDTCGNSLHRLHRIPRENVRALPDVIADSCYCVDKILEIVSNLYPDFNQRVTIQEINR